MIKLNWRDAKIELPLILDATQRKTKACLVVVDKDGEISLTVDHCLIFKEIRVF